MSFPMKIQSSDFFGFSRSTMARLYKFSRYVCVEAQKRFGRGLTAEQICPIAWVLNLLIERGEIY